MIEKNEVYRAVIEGYSAEGLGVARIDGQVVFVRDGVRGETCRVRIEKVLKNAAYGKALSWETPSAHRQTPDCPYYKQCGGCDFRHIDYEEELYAKLCRVRDALRRLGGTETAVEEIIGATDTLRYRNKAQYDVSPAGEVGFYRRRTHQVVDVERCLLQSEAADAAAAARSASVGFSGIMTEYSAAAAKHTASKNAAMEAHDLMPMIVPFEKLRGNDPALQNIVVCSILYQLFKPPSML